MTNNGAVLRSAQFMVAGLTLMFLIAARALGAQAAIGRLATPVSCDSCQITAKTIVSFQSVWDAGGLPSLPTAVSRFATDGWVVLDGANGVAYRFDRHGRFVANVASRGNGPGELVGPSAAFPVRGDSTFLIDAVRRRISVFDPHGRYQRSFRWHGGSQQRVMLSPSGAFIVAGRHNAPSSVGMPFHEFSRDGSLVRSFGSTDGGDIRTPGDLPFYRTPTRTRGDGSFWTVEARWPRLRLWRSDGTVGDQWELPLGGFAPLVSMRRDAPPGMEFFTIEEIAPQLLVLSMAYREARHAESFGRSIAVDGQRGERIDDYGLYFSSRIFVLDVTSRSLLAAIDLDAFVVGSLGDGLYWVVSPGNEGGELQLIRLRLER